MAMLAVAVVLGVTAARPQHAEAAVAATTCMDGTWADYNECLVEAGSEFRRKFCDLEFLVDTYVCADKALKE